METFCLNFSWYTIVIYITSLRAVDTHTYFVTQVLQKRFPPVSEEQLVHTHLLHTTQLCFLRMIPKDASQREHSLTSSNEATAGKGGLVAVKLVSEFFRLSAPLKLLPDIAIHRCSFSFQIFISLSSLHLRKKDSWGPTKRRQ